MSFERVEIGPHVLYRGDCLEILPTLAPGSVDAVVTDPPYSSGGAYRGDRTNSTLAKYVRSELHETYTGKEFTGDNRDQRAFLAWSTMWLIAAAEAASAGAVLCSFIDWRQLPVLTDAVQCAGWTWRNLATWWKPGCRMQKGRLSSSAEYVVYATNGPHESDGEKSPQNVFSFASLQTEDKLHIAEKPIEVFDWLLGLCKPKCTVLDPFIGSGAAGVATAMSGRKIVGIEKDPRYFDIACRRIEEAEGKGTLFEEVKPESPTLFEALV